MLTKLLNPDLSKAPMDLAVLILRIFSGAFMMTHGVPKVQKIMGGDLSFGDPIGLGPEISLILTAFAEAFCGLLIVLGLGTRLASIPLIITMGVAGFIHHASDPFGGKEKALLFLLIFVVLLITGGGKYSMEQRIVN